MKKILQEFKQFAMRGNVVDMAVGIIIGGAFGKIVSSQRPRPEDIVHLVREGGFSFPSGHSITSMFVYGMLLYLICQHVADRRLRILLSVLAAIPLVLVGPSRIYLGVHYPTDVLAGWCLGFAVLMAEIGILQRIYKKSRKEDEK